MKKIAIVVGARPELSKMSPVVRACEGRGLDWCMIRTGQHYSHNMDRVFFEQLELPDARHNLDVGSGSWGHGEQTGKMLTGIETILLAEKPGVVLVEGNTNTVLAGVLAASKLGIGLGMWKRGCGAMTGGCPKRLTGLWQITFRIICLRPLKNQGTFFLMRGFLMGRYSLPETRLLMRFIRI